MDPSVNASYSTLVQWVHTTRRSVVAAVLGAIALTATARAQWDPIDTEELQRMKEVLLLDDGQARLVDGLFGGYVAELKQIQLQPQVGNEDLNARQRAISGLASRWAMIRHRRQLNEQFLNDVEVVLTSEQSQRFPRIECARRRNGVLPYSHLPGIHVDLVDVFETLGLPHTTNIDALLLDYELQLDRLLRQREEAWTETWQLVITGDLHDAHGVLQREERIPAGRHLAETKVDQDLAIQRLNDRCLIAIGVELSVEQADALRLEYQRRFAYSYYKPGTYISSVYDYVLAHELLDDTRRDAVRTLRDRFLGFEDRLRLDVASAERQETTVKALTRVGKADEDDLMAAEEAFVRARSAEKENQEAAFSRLHGALDVAFIREAKLREFFTATSRAQRLNAWRRLQRELDSDDR